MKKSRLEKNTRILMKASTNDLGHLLRLRGTWAYI